MPCYAVQHGAYNSMSLLLAVWVYIWGFPCHMLFWGRSCRCGLCCFVAELHCTVCGVTVWRFGDPLIRPGVPPRALGRELRRAR